MTVTLNAKNFSMLVRHVQADAKHSIVSVEFAIKKYQEPILRAVSHYSRRFSITNLGMLQGSFRIGELLRRLKFRKLEAGIIILSVKCIVQALKLEL